MLVVESGTRWIGTAMSVFISRIGGSVSFLTVISYVACSLILTGDEKVVHIDTKCIFFIWTSLAWYRFDALLFY